MHPPQCRTLAGRPVAEARFCRLDRRGNAAARAELAEYAAQQGLDGHLRQIELAGDLLVRHPPRNPPQNVPLPEGIEGKANPRPVRRAGFGGAPFTASIRSTRARSSARSSLRWISSVRPWSGAAADISNRLLVNPRIATRMSVRSRATATARSAGASGPPAGRPSSCGFLCSMSVKCSFRKSQSRLRFNNLSMLSRVLRFAMALPPSSRRAGPARYLGIIRRHWKCILCIPTCHQCIGTARSSMTQAKIKLASIDLNLLIVFDAVMQERSVTRAGVRLGLSQPAMSHALTRLRHMLGDALFVRSPNGMVPTPRAEQLTLPVKQAPGRTGTGARTRTVRSRQGEPVIPDRGR